MKEQPQRQTHTHTHKQTDRQSDRETDRQTISHTDNILIEKSTKIHIKRNSFPLILIDIGEVH